MAYYLAMKWNERFKLRYNQLKSDKGITQYSLAEALGVSQGTVANWLSGTREPRTLADFEKLAATLGVSSDWLMNGDDASGALEETLQKLPLLKPEQIAEWFNDELPSVNEYSPLAMLPYHSGSGYTASHKAYAIKAMDSGLEPRISAGDTVYIDPILPPKSGKLIAVDFNGNGIISIGQLVSVGPEYKLKMTNDSFALPSDFAATIYRGSVIAVMLNF